MRHTIERAYWSGDFETAEAQKARTKQGRGIATRATKGSARGCRQRQGRGSRAERELVVTEEVERAYWSGDFETAEAQKACTKQGHGIATRVTKGGVRGCRPRQGRESRAERELVELVVMEELEVEGKTAMDLYTTLDPRPARLGSVQAATG
jgi:hypothetical protein